LHIDVTYLPKIDGVKYYLFVAIDRATRTLYYKVYDAKTSENAEDFMIKCLDFFPFGISHALTDNGLERRSPHEHLKFKLLNVSNLLTN